MNENLKDNIYLFANMTAWILLSIGAVVMITHFIGVMVLRIFLSVTAVIGMAYFEERIFCRVISKVVSFFLHDE